MDTEQFLKTVLGDEGFYCTVCIKENKQVTQEFKESIEDVVQSVKQIDAAGNEAYFAVSTFKEKQRKAEYAEQLKTLFLDIDCGEGKDYATRNEGLDALKAFYKRYKLPPTLIVNSGRGWHVYWVLDKPCSRDEWITVAEQLKNACSDFGLKADTAVTADAARILRPVGTRNYKGNVPLPVELYSSSNYITSLQEFKDKLPNSLMPVLPQREYSEEDKRDMELASGGGERYSYSLTDILNKSVTGKGCQQIHRAVEKPNEITYNQWIDVLSVVKECEEGPKAIHVISNKYDKYSKSETESVAAGLKWAHHCTTFEQNNPDGCADCIHKDSPKIRSPKDLGRRLLKKVQEETETQVTEQEDPKQPIIPKYPYPYFSLRNGGIGVMETDDEGNQFEKPLCDTDFYIVKRLRDKIVGPAYIFRHHTKQEGIREFMIPAQKLISTESFKIQMSKNDIFTLAPMDLMKYVAAWIAQVKDVNGLPEIQVADQFGWTDNNKSFILGDREIHADSIEPNYPSSVTEDYFMHFEKKGSLEEWKKIPKFFDKVGFEPHQYMFGLSFAAPLMVFAPKIAGSIFHLKSSESGFGKSTGQFAGASVWGDPTLVVQKGDDTIASIWKVTETYKNIIIYCDELSNKGGKELSGFAYDVSGGKQRNRLRGSSEINKERYRGNPWRTLVGTSGNTSILETISAEFRESPKGETQRVLEAETMVKLKEDSATTREGIELNMLLENNYGHAGEKYIQFVVKRKDVIEKILLQKIEQLIKQTELSAQNRFWLWQAAGVLTGLLIASRLGLHSLNIDNLQDWICKQLRHARDETVKMTVDIHDTIAAYLADNNRSILRLKSTDKEVYDPEMETLISPEQLPMYKFVGRHEFDTNTLYLLPAPFKKWCLLRKIDYGSTRRAIMEQMNGTAMKFRLGTNTNLKLPSTHVLKLSWSEEVTESIT